MILFGLVTLAVLAVCLAGSDMSKDPAPVQAAALLCFAWTCTIVLPARYYCGVDVICLMLLAGTLSRHPAVVTIGFCFVGQLVAHLLRLWVPPQIDHDTYARILDWGYIVQLIAAGAFGGGYVLDGIRRYMSDRGGADLGLRAR